MWFPFFVVLLTLSCTAAPTLPEHPEAAEQSELHLDPGPVPVLSIALVSDVNWSEGELLLAETQISSVSVNRLAEGELTDALAEKLVPILERIDGPRIEVRPLAPLAVGQTYTVLSRRGLHGTFEVEASDLTYLARLWPPPNLETAIVQGIYCGSDLPREPVTVELYPEGEARFSPGLDPSGMLAETCGRLEVNRPVPERFAPPTQLEGAALDPAPFYCGVPDEPIPNMVCTQGEGPLGPGCARRQGAGLRIRTPEVPMWWVFASRLGAHFAASDVGAELFVPASDELAGEPIELVVFDQAGRSTKTSFALDGVEQTARLVLNEVMANPKGPEPAQEWIELVNAGGASDDLGRYQLADAGGTIALPSVQMPPMSVVLLVRDDFDATTPDDVPLPSDTVLVRVPQLGRSGISNSGEALTLLATDGTVVSRFPARPASVQGTSVARAHLFIVDDESTGFGPHAEPGASPGAPNLLEVSVD